MGWETTRIIRIYPKNKSNDFSIVKFCKNIADTATGLTTHVLWSNNRLENCYDIKFESSKSAGELEFDSKEVDVWEIKSYDYGGTIIGFYNKENNSSNSISFRKAEFFFDEIKLDGTKRGVDAFLEVTSLKKDHKQEPIRINGKYHAGNHYQTIPLNNNVKGKTAQVDIDELLKLKGDCCWIDSFLQSKSLKIELDNFLEFVNGDVYENYFPGLDKIEFYYKNRCVKKIKWMPTKGYENGMWFHSSSDWWDNCANINWIEYQKKKTTENNA